MEACRYQAGGRLSRGEAFDGTAETAKTNSWIRQRMLRPYQTLWIFLSGGGIGRIISAAGMDRVIQFGVPEAVIQSNINLMEG